MASTKIVARSSNEKEYKIYVAYYHDHNNAHFNTGIKIPKEFFQDSQTDPIAGRYPGAKEKNKIIRAIKTKIDSLIHNQIATNESLHVDAIRLAFKPETATNNKSSMATLWGEFLESKKGTVETQTHGNYERSLLAFSKLPASKVPPSKFGIIQFNHYQSYLKEKYAPNTAAKMLRHFRAFVDYLETDKIPCGIEKSKIRYKERPGLKLSLSEEQLENYRTSDRIPKHLIKVRDLILIQCATGLRISDHKRIDKNIVGNKIVIEAKKTRNNMEIPITPMIREILEKYDYILPIISEQKYRDGIKAIHKLLYPDQMVQVREGNSYKNVFVHEEISSHDMVRTFVTLSHDRGMSVNSIAKITGKTVKVLLSSYLVESQKVADKEMEKAWGIAPLKIAR